MATTIDSKPAVSRGPREVESAPESRTWTQVKRLLWPLASLKLTVVLFALSIFILDKGPLSGEFQPFWDEAGGFATGLGIIFVGTMLKPAPKVDPFEYLDK